MFQHVLCAQYIRIYPQKLIYSQTKCVEVILQPYSDLAAQNLSGATFEI